MQSNSIIQTPLTDCRIYREIFDATYGFRRKLEYRLFPLGCKSLLKIYFAKFLFEGVPIRNILPGGTSSYTNLLSPEPLNRSLPKIHNCVANGFRNHDINRTGPVDKLRETREPKMPPQFFCS